MAIAEHDQVLIRHDVPAAGLRAGDVGMVVGVYGQGRAFEVEFMTADGDTVAVETLAVEQVEPLTGRRILNARPLVIG